LVVQEDGPMSYSVLSGDLEYHAAARAKQLNPRAGEMVNAFVAKPAPEPTIGEMLEEQKAGADGTKQEPAKAKAKKPSAKQSKAKAKTKPSKLRPKKIGSYDDFKTAVIQATNKLNRDYNLSGLVPIHRVKETLGDRVSDEQFDEYLLDMQGDDHIQLSDSPPPGNEHLGFGPFSRYYLTNLTGNQDAGPDDIVDHPNKISSYEEFTSEIVDLIDKIDQEEGHHGLVPIHEVRRALGDRLSRKEFQDWLIQSHVDDLVQLQAYQSAGTSKQEDREDSVMLGHGKFANLKYFVQLLPKTKQ
jgi:hypothetical protein